MNKFLTAILLSCLLFSCDIRKGKSKNDVTAQQASQKITDSTTVQMVDSVYNFGKVTDGEKVEFSYRFINTGKHPLIITAATASCGCTVPEKPDEPVKPGETGFLKVVFNSKDHIGIANKQINIVSNAYPAFPVLQLNGEVIAKGK